MAKLLTPLTDKHLNSKFTRDVEAFEARKGRLPTMDEINKEPRLRKGMEEMCLDFVGGDPASKTGYAFVGCQHSLVAPAPDCTEECDICRPQWLLGIQIECKGYDACYTDPDAQAQLDFARHKIQDDIYRVRNRLLKYGDTVVKRWQKRSTSKRSALLKRALPDMYAKKESPLVEFFTFDVQPGLVEDFMDERMRRLRTSELLPYLEVESLSESPLDILALLYHRSEHPLTEWATFDLHQHEYNFKAGLVLSGYNPHCVAMSGSRYVVLVPFQKDGIRAGTVVSFPRAKLLFEA